MQYLHLTVGMTSSLPTDFSSVFVVQSSSSVEGVAEAEHLIFECIDSLFKLYLCLLSG